jgi:hypothetical protein
MAKKIKPLLSNNFNHITLNVDFGELAKSALYALIIYKVIDVLVVLLS